MNKTLKFAFWILAFNIAFSAYYLVFGIADRSWWLLALGIYYFTLSAVRFVALKCKGSDRFVRGFTGWMLMALSLPLAATVILSVVRDRGHKIHTIVMIAIAAYAFTRITLATVNLIRSRRSTSDRVVTLRRISFADAFVSIFALQRSMLVSFEGMTEAQIRIMNAVIGSLVCVTVFLFGLGLTKKSIKNKNED